MSSGVNAFAIAVYRHEPTGRGVQVLASRPSILGLEADNVRLIVGYLQDNDYTPEQVSEYLKNTI